MHKLFNDRLEALVNGLTVFIVGVSRLTLVIGAATMIAAFWGWVLFRADPCNPVVFLKTFALSFFCLLALAIASAAESKKAQPSRGK
jgi:hypothetical protein